MINRRIIRINAIQNLYIFYICEIVNKKLAIEKINFNKIKINNFIIEKKMVLKDFFNLLKNSNYKIKNVYFKQRIINSVDIYKKNLSINFNNLKNNLLLNINKIYNISFLILNIIILWYKLTKKIINKNFSLFFYFENKVYQNLKNNIFFSNIIKKDFFINNINFFKDSYIYFLKNNKYFNKKIIFNNYKDNKDYKILLYLINQIIFKNKIIEDFFKKLDIRWLENKAIIYNILLSSIKSYKKKSFLLFNQNINLVSLENFYFNLIFKTIREKKKYDYFIFKVLTNWSIHCISIIDKITIRTAICEMKNFNKIPVNVSINEYIDISKIYSSLKSSKFINGVLDSILTRFNKNF